jgi:hypothetical protein
VVVELSFAFVQTMEVMDFLFYKAVRCDFDFSLLVMEWIYLRLRGIWKVTLGASDRNI